MRKFVLSMIGVVAVLLLSACGGSEGGDANTDTNTDAKKETVKAVNKANNPLASQQQLLRDAKGVQAILDADEAKKKKALEDIN